MEDELTVHDLIYLVDRYIDNTLNAPDLQEHNNLTTLFIQQWSNMRYNYLNSTPRRERKYDMSIANVKRAVLNTVKEELMADVEQIIANLDNDDIISKIKEECNVTSIADGLMKDVVAELASRWSGDIDDQYDASDIVDAIENS
jgi:hypothetical protein